MSEWTYLLTEPDGSRLGELTAATSRRMTLNLRSPSEASFTLPGRHAEALLPAELATDLHVLLGDDTLFRGRIGPSQDQAGADNYSVTFTAHDYRGVLARRLLWSDLRWDEGGEADQEAIGWAMIQHAQAQVAGHYGIVRGEDQATGRLRSGTWEAGRYVGEAIQQLSERSDGFDWSIEPDLTYRVWYPHRGREVSFALDYGGRVTQFSRSFSAQHFANAVRASGTEEAVPQSAIVDDIVSRPEGRWDLQQGFPDIGSEEALLSHAEGLLEHRSNLAPSWTVHVAQGSWTSPDDLWLGDVAPLTVEEGRLEVVREPHRVERLVFTLGDDGSEGLAVSLDAV